MRRELFAMTLGAVAMFVSTATLAAQRTWTVGGAGADFQKLAPAFAAAKDGDTVRVRAGVYDGAITSKALRLIGEAGAQLRAWRLLLGPPVQPLVVRGLAAGKRFELSGFSLEPKGVGPLEGPFVSFEDCKGSIVVEGTDLTATFAPNSGGFTLQAFTIRDCASVSLTRVACHPELSVERSTVTLSECSLSGASSFKIPFTSSLTGSGPALRLGNATAIVTDATATGGSGLQGILSSALAYPAVQATSSQVVLLGDSSSMFRAGSGPGRDPSGTPALLGTGSNLLIDTRIQLVPSGRAAGAQGFVRVDSRRRARLAVRRAPGGLRVETEAVASGNLAALFVSRSSGPSSTALGQLWLDPASLLLVDAGTTDARGKRVVSLPAPAGLSGALVFQSLSVGTFAELTNPVGVVF